MSDCPATQCRHVSVCWVRSWLTIWSSFINIVHCSLATWSPVGSSLNTVSHKEHVKTGTLPHDLHTQPSFFFSPSLRLTIIAFDLRICLGFSGIRPDSHFIDVSVPSPVHVLPDWAHEYSCISSFTHTVFDIFQEDKKKCALLVFVKEECAITHSHTHAPNNTITAMLKFHSLISALKHRNWLLQ